VRDRQKAEQLTVDAFHGIWTRAGAYRADRGTVVAWVMSEARQCALQAAGHETAARSDIPAPADPSQGKRLRAAVALLSTEERDAIETAFFSPRCAAEATCSLGQPPDIERKRTRDAIEKLRLALREEAGR
jgi:RNA polymerase sigma-70 factor (ECF subfamily)